MTYESIMPVAQFGGLIFFIVLFAGVVVYALWPGNRDKFERASRAPLDDDSIEE